jgi:hypothetical protein
LHTEILGSIAGRVGIFNKKRFLSGTRSDGGAELQLLVYVPNIPGLNPKSLHSAYNVNTYVLLIVIGLSNGDFQPGDILGAY